MKIEDKMNQLVVIVHKDNSNYFWNESKGWTTLNEATKYLYWYSASLDSPYNGQPESYTTALSRHTDPNKK
jgi:hypothetical protein